MQLPQILLEFHQHDIIFHLWLIFICNLLKGCLPRIFPLCSLYRNLTHLLFHIFSTPPESIVFFPVPAPYGS